MEVGSLISLLWLPRESQRNSGLMKVSYQANNADGVYPRNGCLLPDEGVQMH